VRVGGKSRAALPSGKHRKKLTRQNTTIGCRMSSDFQYLLHDCTKLVSYARPSLGKIFGAGVGNQNRGEFLPMMRARREEFFVCACGCLAPPCCWCRPCAPEGAKSFTVEQILERTLPFPTDGRGRRGKERGEGGAWRGCVQFEGGAQKRMGGLGGSRFEPRQGDAIIWVTRDSHWLRYG